MVTTDRVRVGATLRALREAQGVKLEKLAEAIELDRSTLSNIEAGRRRLTPEKARLAADALNVPLAAIISPALHDDPDVLPSEGVESNRARRRRNSGGLSKDTTVISLGDGGTVTVTFEIRMLQMKNEHVQALLKKVDEFRELGAEIEEAMESDDYTNPESLSS